MICWTAVAHTSQRAPLQTRFPGEQESAQGGGLLLAGQKETKKKVNAPRCSKKVIRPQGYDRSTFISLFLSFCSERPGTHPAPTTRRPFDERKQFWVSPW